MTERRTELELEKTTHVPLQTIAEQLLLEVRREREESGKGCLSDDLMSALQFVFHQPLLQALDLLDRNSVSRFVCPAKRELYRVQGSAGRTYTCLVSSNYCSCPSFVYTVLVKEDSLMCKHMLAVQLARAMDAYQEVSQRGTGCLFIDQRPPVFAHALSVATLNNNPNQTFVPPPFVYTKYTG